MANKFKVGDIVIGNDQASQDYSITIKGFKGRVTSVGPDDTISITRLNGLKFEEFGVESKSFDLLQKSVSVSKKGLKAIYPDVCEGWQAKIREALIANILEDDDSDAVSVSPEDLELAYAQADPEQKENLEIYLKISKFLPKKESVNDLEIGQIFLVDSKDGSTFSDLHIMRTFDEYVCLELPNNSWSIETPLNYEGKILKKGTSVSIIAK